MALINGLKIVLPLLALALLATLFLFARTAPNDVDIPFMSELQGNDMGADGIKTAFYTGSTDAGDAIVVQASGVRSDPDDPSQAIAAQLEARIDYKNGSRLTVQSDAAEYADAKNSLRLTGTVKLVSSSGYKMTTEELVTDIRSGTAKAPGQVHATGPAGVITSGAMEINRPHASSDDVHLVFKDGVKLIYHPQVEGE